MKLVMPVLLLLILSAVPRVYAAFYQWTDDNGVIHLTDSRKKIPKKYQKKAKELNPPGNSAPAAVTEPAASAPKAPEEPPPAAAAPPTPGWHPERWWCERFASLRSELKTLQEGLPMKQVRLAELRRERRIFFRARDREAVNEVEAAISADEVRIAELTRELETLELEAARSGVPAEWRR